MIGGEDVTAKRQRNDDEHEHLLVVLDGLEDTPSGRAEASVVIALEIGLP